MDNSISLSCHNDLPYLLVEHPTGVSYSGQVCGIMCDHPQVQGFIIPLEKREWSVLEGSCAVACTHYGLDAKALAWLRQRWPVTTRMEWGHFWGVHVELDDTRAAQGTECWFPVRLAQKVRPKPYSFDSHYSWLDGKTGWLLMYDNCD